MLEEALRLAAHGIPVFPCKPLKKLPATEHGFLDATTDPSQIREWWRRMPNANLAIPTGLPGRDVLDIDIRTSGSGLPHLEILADMGMLTDVLRKVRTPSGGMHLYFRASGLSSSKITGKHIDFKAGGGYVLAPPSYVEEPTYRGSYVEEAVYEPDFPQPLDWAACKLILEPPRFRIPKPESQRKNGGAYVPWVGRQGEGNRNHGEFWAACLDIDLTGGSNLGAIEEEAIRSGLGEIEVRRTIQSAMRKKGIA